jgi:hypothetical protein
MLYGQPRSWYVSPSFSPLSKARAYLHQGHAKMCNWPMVVRAARAAMESEGKPIYKPSSRYAESKLITCLSQICRGAGVIHKNKICYNFGAAAFYLSYILDVCTTF